MKTTLRAKLLQHLVSKKKANEGFTLIELLVVIIIIGILAAIALPSFLNQANRARQTEAITNVGAINRGQQAYILEKDFFSRSIFGLGLGVKAESDNYKFGDNAAFATSNVGQILGVDAAGAASYSDTDDSKYRLGGLVYAAPANELKLKAYAGATYLLTETSTKEATSTTILCEENVPGADTIDAIVFTPLVDGLAGNTDCGADSSPK